MPIVRLLLLLRNDNLEKPREQQQQQQEEEEWWWGELHCYYPITPHLSTLGSIQCFSDQDSAFSFKQLLQFFMLVHMGMWSPQSKSVRQTYSVRNITHGVITRRRLGRRGDRSKATTERKVMSIGAIMVAEHFSTPQLQIARRRALSTE